MAFKFEWERFVNFYSSESEHLRTLKQPVQLWFYAQINKYTDTWKLLPTYSSLYFPISKNNVYVTFNQQGWIFFNIIRIDNGKNLGDHMTIGLKDRKGLIDLHYTVQNSTLHRSEKNKCFLRNDMIIDKVEDILCQNPNGKTFKDNFSPDQIESMKEILSKPFQRQGTQQGGVYSPSLKHLRSLGKLNGVHGLCHKTKGEISRMFFHEADGIKD